MTIDAFIVLWFKKGLEVTGGGDALNQCVDLANGYIRDVLGLPIIQFSDAKDFPSNAGDKYDYIKSTPTNFPVLGDIVVWNGNIGSGHGHIAVALGGDKDTFVSVDENWSISQRVTLERHNYDNVDGWLHPKVLPQDAYVAQLESDRLKFWQERDQAQKQIVTLTTQLKASTDDLATSDNVRKSLVQQVLDLQKINAELLKQTNSTEITENEVLAYLKTLTLWQQIGLLFKT